MKKFLALTLSLAMVLAFAGCGAKSEAPAPSAPESTPAAEGTALSGDLVVYSSMTDPDLEALIACFNKVHPDVTIEVVNGSAGELTTRIAGEAASPVGDLVWGGMADSDGDRYAEIFESWTSAHDSENMAGYTSANGLYSMDHLSTVVFCVNNDLEKELGVEIHSYEDLTNPALKGQVLLADPNSSSSAWNNLCNIMAVYGNDTDEAWAYIEKLMPNLVIVGSSSACFKSVQQGEYAVGLTYEDGAVNLVKDGATNIRLQYPTEGTSATAFGTALIKNGPNPENAKAMIDFICSAEGQTALAAYQEGTLRYTNAGYTVPENAWLVPSGDITWAKRDVKYLTENKDTILEHWNDLYAKVVG